MPFLVIDGFTAGLPARRAPPRSSKQTAQVAGLDPAKVHGPSMPDELAFGGHFVVDLELSCLPRYRERHVPTWRGGWTPFTDGQAGNRRQWLP